MGLVGISDAVAFDEVADLQKMPKEVVTTLKTYCESGMFARGKDALSGQASLALFGNTNQPVDVMVRSSHLFSPMPEVIREDMAFIDRLHYYIPGWEIPKMRIEFFTDHYGFVVDYLAEALRELRKHNFTEVIDRHYSLGSHLNARDVKAVRKTVSGLVKLLYPHGELSGEESAELVEMALEGRRRVKEQLKKMGSFEYHQTSFSYIDNDTREERFVGVPEQGGRDTISTDPLAPGSVYAASVDDQGKVGLYRLEVGCSPGTGKLKIAGGIEGPMKESIQRAFAYLQGQKGKMGIAQQVDTTDFHVEAIDLLSNHVPCESGIALVVAIYSAIKRHSVLAGLLVLGDLSIQGNIKSVRSLAEPLQVGMDNGARRALVPLENKRNFVEVSGDIVERVDPVFFSDPMTAAMKALGMT
jgi:ATP-dependent Lon protease